MSRARALRRRAKICGQLLARETHRDMLLWGYSMQMIEWRRALPRGLMLPYWCGLPMVALITEKSTFKMNSGGVSISGGV